MTVSAIYEGSVRHRRFAVRKHEFRRRIALAYIDLDELPGLLGGRLVARRPGLARFRRRDYLGDPRVSLAEAVRNTVAEQAGVRPDGPIRLLTNLSTFGHCFNPVSFYYCMDRSGARVTAVLAEVTNTPWGERHAYVLLAPAEEPQREDSRRREDSRLRANGALDATNGLPERGCGPSRRVLSGSFSKALHVSPFMGMDHRYEWRMTSPAETLSVHIASNRAGQPAFDATLALHRRDLTRASLARMTARYPANTVRTLVAIYVHAVVLKLKGVPVHPHPGSGVA
jgi:uncharacterized protein